MRSRKHLVLEISWKMMQSLVEVEALREGLVAMRFSKDFKHQIRSPWTEALIVKVYGRSVGFSFL